MRGKKFKKELVLGIILLFLGTAIIPTTMSIDSQKTPTSVMQKIWTVDDDRKQWFYADFTDIQSAIIAASTPDEIHVYRGNYTKIEVNKKELRLIGGFSGPSIIIGDGVGNTVSITKEDVTIDNFTINNSGDYQKDDPPYDRDAGIHITANNAKILNNVICNNSGNGIFSSADNTYIAGNRIRDNALDGIGIYEDIDESYTEKTLIEHNKIQANGKDGIYCWRNLQPTIQYNYITENGKNGDRYNAGIKLHRTQGPPNDPTAKSASILLNWITNNTGDGIRIKRYCKNVYIQKNNISGNSENGIVFEDRSIYGDMYRNNFMNNGDKDPKTLDNAYTLKCLINHWEENYWDDWDKSGPYQIPGLWFGFIPSFLDFDSEAQENPWNHPFPVVP